MSQKTYEARFLPSLRIYGDELSQKNGCGTILVPQPTLLLEE